MDPGLRRDLDLLMIDLTNFAIGTLALLRVTDVRGLFWTCGQTYAISCGMIFLPDARDFSVALRLRGSLYFGCKNSENSGKFAVPWRLRCRLPPAFSLQITGGTGQDAATL